MIKRAIIIFIVASMCVQLCACQTNPSNPAVNSKTDGPSYADLVKPTEEGSNISTEMQYSDEFCSTDGSVEFTMNVEQILNVSALPVVEVIPHKLLSEDVKRVANVLFGDAVVYEREPSKNPGYSKDQLQKAIARWSQYTNSTAMSELLIDNSDVAVARRIDSLKGWIADYTEKYDTAPVEDPRTLCDWTFKKERHYNNLELEISGRKESEDLDVIYANAELNDIEYVFTASTRDESDYKLNTIVVSLSSGVGPAEMDLSIYRAMLCRTSKPTDSQILSISEKAQDMLNRMKLGDFLVTNTYVETTYFGDIPEYRVVVEAVPTFSEVPAVYGQLVPSATANDTYAAYYPVSKADFGFSANGDLIDFRLISPVDIKEIVNSNVATLPLDTLVEKAKSTLMLSDVHAGYGVSAELIYMYEEVMNEELVCKIEISTVEYGLARINIENSDNSYYYIPTIVFKGKVDYYGKNTGTLYASSSDYGVNCIDLIWINAVDGTIITN